MLRCANTNTPATTTKKQQQHQWGGVVDYCFIIGMPFFPSLPLCFPPTGHFSYTPVRSMADGTPCVPIRRSPASRRSTITASAFLLPPFLTHRWFGAVTSLAFDHHRPSPVREGVPCCIVTIFGASTRAILGKRASKTLAVIGELLRWPRLARRLDRIFSAHWTRPTAPGRKLLCYVRRGV